MFDISKRKMRIDTSEIIDSDLIWVCNYPLFDWKVNYSNMSWRHYYCWVKTMKNGYYLELYFNINRQEEFFIDVDCHDLTDFLEELVETDPDLLYRLNILTKHFR